MDRKPRECQRCGACCSGWMVRVHPGDNVPEELVERDHVQGETVMRFADAKTQTCIAFDRLTRRFTIYEQRPTVCRAFVPGGEKCDVARSDR